MKVSKLRLSGIPVRDAEQAALWVFVVWVLGASVALCFILPTFNHGHVPIWTQFLFVAGSLVAGVDAFIFRGSVLGRVIIHDAEVHAGEELERIARTYGQIMSPNPGFYSSHSSLYQEVQGWIRRHYETVIVVICGVGNFEAIWEGALEAIPGVELAEMIFNADGIDTLGHLVVFPPEGMSLERMKAALTSLDSVGEIRELVVYKGDFPSVELSEICSFN